MVASPWTWWQGFIFLLPFFPQECNTGSSYYMKQNTNILYSALPISPAILHYWHTQTNYDGVWAGKLRICGCIPGRGKGFYSPKHSDWLRDPPTSHSVGTRVSCPRHKVAELWSWPQLHLVLRFRMCGAVMNDEWCNFFRLHFVFFIETYCTSGFHYGFAQSMGIASWHFAWQSV
jgi:hypothetical protein